MCANHGSTHNEPVNHALQGKVEVYAATQLHDLS